MALDARSRSSIYEKLVPILGEADANVLMSEFPSVEADELVTKHFLRAELAELRGDLRREISELRAELRGEITDLGTQLRGEITDLGTQLRGEITDLGTQLRGENAELRTEHAGSIAGLRAEMADRFRQQTILMGSGFAGTTAVLATLMTFT